MSGHHFVSYYNCGAHVAAQCRCPGPKQKEITNTPCPVCVGAQSAPTRAEDEVAALRKEATEAVKIIDSALPYPTSDLPGGPGPLLSLAQQAHDLLKLSLSELTALRKRVAELELAVDVAESRKSQVLHDLVDRAAKAEQSEEFAIERAETAERERDDAKQYAEEYKKAYLAELDGIKLHMDKLQADLDAALDWIKGVGGPMGRGGYPTDRVLALLEKRRDQRG